MKFPIVTTAKTWLVTVALALAGIAAGNALVRLATTDKPTPCQEGIVVAYPGQTVNCTDPTSRMSVFRVPGSDRMLVECACGRTPGEPPELAPSKVSTVWHSDQDANLSGDLSGFVVRGPGLGSK